MSAKQGLQYFFDLYDVDKDGFLSLEELRTFLGDNKFDCQTGSENAEQTMDENDVDRDGKLDFEDFSFLLFHEKGYVELFYDCDQNHDGCDYSQFLTRQFH
jgi:Ca2+-binding EF-hand superfamily protein